MRYVRLSQVSVIKSHIMEVCIWASGVITAGHDGLFNE